MNDIKSNCALSHANSKHFALKPVKLSCGHFSCEKCVKSSVKEKLSCNYCGKTHEFNDNVEDDKDVVEYRRLLESNFKDIHDEIKKEFERTYKLVEEKEQSLHTKIECMIEEIDTRVESLKIQLDQHKNELKQTLEGLKESVGRDCKLGDLRNKMAVTRLDDDKQGIIKEEDLVQLQEDIESMRLMIEKLENELTYQIADTKIDANLIVLSNESILENNFKRLSEYPLIKFWPFEDNDEDNMDTGSICVLPNSYVLISEELSLRLLNQNLRTIETRSNFDLYSSSTYNKSERCTFGSVTSDDQNNVYAIDKRNVSVMKFNIELKLIKFIDLKSNANSHINELCFDNGFLYVGSQGKIEKFDKKLKLISTYELKGHNPGAICVINNVLAFTSQEGVYCYKLDPIVQLSFVQQPCTHVSSINNRFCVVKAASARVMFYNSETFALEKEIDLQHQMLDERREIIDVLSYQNRYLVHAYNFDGQTAISYFIIV